MVGRYGIVHSNLLADIGNSYFHIYNGKTVEHLNYDDAIQKYKGTPLKYISVNQKIEAKIADIGVFAPA